MFGGEYHHTKDSKNRVFMPAKLREELGETFVIAKDVRTKCLKVYSLSGWEEYIAPLKQQSRSFAESVFDRFRNPFIQHKWRSIALNSVSKFSVRVLPTLLEYKEQKGEYPKCLTLSLAALIYFYKNDTPEDNEAVVEKIKKGSIPEILSDTSLWQADLSDLTEIIDNYYEKIKTQGAKETVKWILSE